MYKIDIVCYFSDCSIILLQEFACDLSEKVIIMQQICIYLHYKTVMMSVCAFHLAREI